MRRTRREVAPAGTAWADQAATRAPEPADPGPHLLFNASSYLVAGFVFTFLCGVWIGREGEFEGRFAPASVATYGVIALLALTGLGGHPFRRFGPPNIVTTIRAVFTSLMAGLAFEAGRLSDPALAHWIWGFAAIAFAAVALDGIDGYLARRLGLASTFGARYDMEVDAFLVLVLSIIVFQLGNTGPWILAIGLMRYVFLLAGRIVPLLSAELPPSRRRKVICAVQSLALCLMMVPLLPPVPLRMLGLATLALLTYSFLVDVLWLWRNRPRTA